jgi:hypothetical protein
MALSITDPTKKRPSPPIMGALGEDANAFRGLAYNRPLSDQVQGGAAGPAVDAFNANARAAATAGLNLPSPAAAAAPAGIAAPPTAVRDPAVPVAATATAPAFGNTAAGAAGTAVRPATSNAGRTLGYGATDSAGQRSFGNNDIAAINARAAGGSRSDGGIGGGIGSEAAGGTPELGAFSGGVGIAARPIVVDPDASARAGNIEAQRTAASDAASIASRDTRSVSGTAARAAAIDANSSFGTPASRKIAYEAALGNLGGAAAAGIKPQADLGIAGVQEAGATTRAGINAQASIAGDLLRNRPTPAQVPLADGTLGLLGHDGVVRPATGADGKPVKPIQTKDDSAAKRSAEIQDLLAKTTRTYLTNIVQPGQAATPEQLAQARLLAVQTHGLPTATGPNGQKIVNINGEWKPL